MKKIISLVVLFLFILFPILSYGQKTIQLNPAGKKPLFIVDGKMFSSEDLKILEPSNIEEVTILKDTSAIKIYGEKGKNGVIVITMKKPKGGKVDMNRAYILLDDKEITAKEFHKLDHRKVDTLITVVDTIAATRYGDKAKFGAIIIKSKIDKEE